VTPDRGPLRRARLVAAAVLVAVFIAGGLVGAAYVRVVQHGGWRDRVQAMQGRHHRPRLFSPEGEMGARLHLTPEQSARIQEIIRADSARTDSLLRSVRPVFRAHFDSTAAAIRGVLTPEQRAEFDRYRTERRREMMRNIRRGAPPPPPEAVPK
jgi:Spy/CpxP family protein refolding chaperone